MRVENWNPNKFDQEIENISMSRLVEAAEVVAKKARKNLHPKHNISRPVYKTGKDKGKIWTSRDAGRLKKSIRVVRKKTKSGKAFARKQNVRVYAGHYTAYYVYWVEYGSSKAPAQPFLRPAFYSSMSKMKSIIGVR